MKSIEDQVSGSLLVSARSRVGLTQTAFAELLGIAQPTLSAYESGRRQPTLPMLLRLLGRAGLDLRMEVVEQDRHDAVLAEWELSGVSVPVASLEDVVTSTRSAGRPKDIVALPALEARLRRDRT